jgi:hypothetical protein
MKHLPRLSNGARRIGGVGGAQFERCIRPAQALEVYGRYCGPGFGDSTGCTPPIDEVDAVCCRHDVCYSLVGSHDCRCDRALLGEIDSAIAKEDIKGNRAAVVAGTFVKAVFSAKPCVCGEVCIPGTDWCSPILASPFICPVAPARIW